MTEMKTWSNELRFLPTVARAFLQSQTFQLSLVLSSNVSPFHSILMPK